MRMKENLMNLLPVNLDGLHVALVVALCVFAYLHNKAQARYVKVWREYMSFRKMVLLFASIQAVSFVFKNINKNATGKD